MMPPIGGNTALLLDIDGTLLDLARTPDLVRVPGDLVRALEKLAHQLSGALAFVSGRSLDNIDRLFAPLRPAAVGAHGGATRGAAGRGTRAPPLPEALPPRSPAPGPPLPGLLLEDKGSAVALHYRLAPEALPVLLSAMDKHARLFESEKVNVIHGKAVFEARHGGVDKGTAVASLLRQPPFAGRRVLFGGDDTTDLDVFRILPHLGGRGFSVGKRFPGVEHVFESPHGVRQWLCRVAEAGG